MVFTCATGKHRRPRRMKHAASRAVGVAALTATGVMGTLSAPASAADTSARHTGLTHVIDIGDAVAEQIDAQAAAQEQAAAQKRAGAEARKQAEEAARRAREAKERAAREAERKRLHTYVAPISGSYVSTGYQAGGALWSSGSHTGIDFHASSGTPVHAVGSGTVVRAGWGGAYGNEIIIKMNDGTYTQYGHLSSLSVSVGQKVTPGQKIGSSGATGNVTGAHLHFEARATAEYGSDINPLTYLRAHGAKL